MKTHEAKRQAAGLRPFAAVCAIAFAAFGAVACSGRQASVAPLPTSNEQAPADSWPKGGGSDPSVPPAAQVFRGRGAESGEPAPTF